MQQSPLKGLYSGVSLAHSTRMKRLARITNALAYDGTVLIKSLQKIKMCIFSTAEDKCLGYETYAKKSILK
jgi:hypothetical protein